MGKRHPNNGPTFTKKPSTPQARPPAISPDRIEAALAVAKLDADKSRRSHKLLHDDPKAWVREYVLPKKDKQE
jgi:hypothetical protein